jgi:acylphosphatase
MNKPDGSVFIEAEGEDIDVNTFADWCAQGPEWSRVLKITKSELPLVGNTKFEVR